MREEKGEDDGEASKASEKKEEVKCAKNCNNGDDASIASGSCRATPQASPRASPTGSIGSADNRSSIMSAASPTATQTPNRFQSAFNAWGRLSRLKESASFDSSQPPSTHGSAASATPVTAGRASPLLVGGIERVGGLRHFALDDILGDGHPLMPPSMPYARKNSEQVS